MKEFYTKPEIYFDDLASRVDKYLTLESSTNGVDKIINHTSEGDKSILNLSELNEWGNEVTEIECTNITDFASIPSCSKSIIDETEVNGIILHTEYEGTAYNNYMITESAFPNYDGVVFKFGFNPELEDCTIKLPSKWNSTYLELTDLGDVPGKVLEGSDAELFVPDVNKYYTLNEKVLGTIVYQGQSISTTFYTYKEVLFESISFDTIHNAVTYIKPLAKEKVLKLNYNSSTQAITVDGADDLEDLTIRKVKTDPIRVEVTSSIVGYIILTGVISSYEIDDEELSGKIQEISLIAAPADEDTTSKSLAYISNLNMYNKYTREYQDGAWGNWTNNSVQILYKGSSAPVVTLTDNGTHTITAPTRNAYAALNVQVDVPTSDPPVVGSLLAEANDTYSPSTYGFDYFDSVEVNVQP